MKMHPLVMYNGKVTVYDIDTIQKQVHISLKKNNNETNADLQKYILASCKYLYNEGFLENEDIATWTTHASIVLA